MKIDLTSEEKKALEVQHKTECDGRIKDQIKAILSLKQQLNQKNETVNEEFLSRFAKFWRDYSRDS